MDRINYLTADDFETVTLNQFKWINEPKKWKIIDGDVKVNVTTDKETDFWQTTWYNFKHHSGHVFGVDIKGDFTFTTKVEADFSHLYDQAGLMLIIDEKHWIKTGIEYNDGQPMIGSVLTSDLSDWATGIFQGDPKKFWIRLSKVGEVICIKYSSDNVLWNLLRLCPFPKAETCFVGLMCCTPLRKGLDVSFCDIHISKPEADILHNNGHSTRICNIHFLYFIEIKHTKLNIFCYRMCILNLLTNEILDDEDLLLVRSLLECMK